MTYEEALGTAVGLEPEALAYFKARLADIKDQVDKEIVLNDALGTAIALSSAVSQKRLAGSMRYFERNGFITHSR